MEKRIRVILADCHAVVRAGFREFLAADPGLVIVAEACTACEALQLVAEHQPDVLVSDLQMPGLTCQELLGAGKTRFPHVRTLVLCLFTDAPYVSALSRAGADAWLLKQARCEELVAAVKAVAARSPYPN
jgi:DNA-binding NarL/FixJ family response regulator